MTDRKRRKKNKLRGQRTMGAGNTKNRRGAGSRGGRGNAGHRKHKIATFNPLREKKYLLKAHKKMEEITLGSLDRELDSLVAKGKVTKEGDKYIVDKKSGYGKVLSQGNTDKEIVLKINASIGAVKKIVRAGGSFEYKKVGFEKEVDEAISSAEEAELEFEEKDEQ
jgi:large subunit ribosomal protein L15